MFLLNFIPDALILWVVNAILISGIVGTIVSFFFGFFARFIPQLYAIRMPLQIISLILLIGGVYFKGGVGVEMEWRARVAQLEAQKNREAIQKDLAEAKYEALKSQQYLTDKMSECCCEIKGKMDLIDRDRLRDNLVVEREDNNLLKILEVAGLGRGGYGGYGGYERGSRSPGRRRH